VGGPGERAGAVGAAERARRCGDRPGLSPVRGRTSARGAPLLDLEVIVPKTFHYKIALHCIANLK